MAVQSGFKAFASLGTEKRLPGCGQATGYAYAFDKSGLQYTSVSVPLPGPGNAYNLVEGRNYIAVESHAWVTWAWVSAFDLKLTASRS